MRLSLFERKQILRVCDKVFGEAKIYLFGSRTDDKQAGGDIDLYVEPVDKCELFQKKIRFLTSLQECLGEQKIDLVFNAQGVLMSEIKENGIDLFDVKLQKYFNQCDKHLQRINEAFEELVTFTPISASEYTTLSKEQVQALDQYLFRFAKLQDTLEDKIFRALVALHVENHLEKSFIDMLNTLEKIGYIYSAKEWINLRQIRNNISHQYDDEPQNCAQAINEIVNCKKIIEKIYNGVKEKYKEVTA